MIKLPPLGTPTPLPIGEFLEPDFPGFRVEAYQRGYKWKQQEVTALLDDIWSFEPSGDEAAYCLQPIVVAQSVEPSRRWELIDGQQRLTTIYIILCYLRASPSGLSYRTRPASRDFLEKMPEWPSEAQPEWHRFIETNPVLDNVDNFHFHQAWQTVAGWFAKDPARRSFLPRLRDCRVIWLRHFPEPSLLHRFVADNVTYGERALFCALTQGILHLATGVSSQEFHRWMRITRNLVEHSSLVGDTLPGVIRAIAELRSEAGGDLLAFLAAPGRRKPATLSEYQWTEEVMKAQLIRTDEAWETTLVWAENHRWFVGQIGFLLTADEKAPLSIESFRERAEKAMLVFADEGLAEPGASLFQRALLTTGDYTKDSGPNYSLGSSSGYWVRRLREDPSFAQRVLGLLDAVQIDSLAADLEALCQAYRDRDWKWFFIRSPHALQACGGNRIQWKNEGRNILLLHGQRASTQDHELRSYCLLEQLEPDAGEFAPLAWVAVKSGAGRPYIALRGFEFDLEVRHVEGAPQDSEGLYKVSFIAKDASLAPKVPVGFIVEELAASEPSGRGCFRTFPDEKSTRAALGSIYQQLRTSGLPHPLVAPAITS